MNTVKKGNEFEDLVFRICNKLVTGYSANNMTFELFKHKGYFSMARNSEIIFDISIEIKVDKKTDPFLLIFIECKNYTKKVPIDDIEEFNSKVEQISPRGAKAVLATTSGFSETSIQYAKSRGIGLIKVFNHNKYTWVVPREVYGAITYIDIENANEECLETLQNEDSFIYNNFIIAYYNKPYNRLTDFINNFTNLDFHRTDNVYLFYEIFYHKTSFCIKYLANHDIDEITNNFYDNYKKYFKEISISNIILYLQNEYGYSVEQHDNLNTVNDQKYLAFTDYNNKKVLVSSKLNENKNRYLFTLVHELSHLILHEPILRDISECSDCNLKFMISERNCLNMEKQANLLASSILIPTKDLEKYLRVIIDEFNLVYRGYYIYLDSQPCNIKQFMIIAKFLQHYFPASIETIKIRLKTIGFLKEENTHEYFK